MNNQISYSDASTKTPQVRVRNLQNIFNSIPKNDIIVYCDSSKLSNANTGAGFAIYQLGRFIKSGAFPLGKQKEIGDAEAFATLQGIKATISLPAARLSKDLWVFTDNQGVVKRLLTKSLTLTSQLIYLEAIESTKKWKIKAKVPHIAEGEIKIHWVSSHARLGSNALADSEAKRGAAILFSGQHQKHSLASLQQQLLVQMKFLRERCLESHALRSHT